MQRLLRLNIVCLHLIIALLGREFALAAEGQPVRIIFDTDMDSDCDDVGALAMLHALADNKEAEVLGVMISAGNRWSAPCAQAINAYYGRPDLPVAVPLRAGPNEQSSRYAQKIAEQGIGSKKDWPVATTLYRQLLADQPNQSVTIVTVGDLTNLAQLLETPSDAFSQQTGRELVQSKVSQWVCMGSRYPADLDPQPWGNFKMDPQSTVQAIKHWPTTITFTGGGKFAESVATGARVGTLPKDNPVRQAYQLYFGGTAKNRHSADQIAVLVAVRGTGQPWKLVREGHNHIFDDGRHEWRTDTDNPQHQFISALHEQADPEKVAQEMEDLMLHQPLKSKAK